MSSTFTIEEWLLSRKKQIVAQPARGLGIWAKTTIRVKDGDRVLVEHSHKCRSFLRNFGRFVRNLFDMPDNTLASIQDQTDVLGATRKLRLFSGYITGGNEAVVAAAGKIGFGDSLTAVDSGQTELQGTILGKGVVTYANITESSSSSQWSLTGSVVNSGAPFTVREIALYGEMRDALVAGQIREIMYLRDLTTVTVVGTGLTIEGEYDFTVNI